MFIACIESEFYAKYIMCFGLLHLVFLVSICRKFLLLHNALWNLCIVHSKTNALLLNVENFHLH